MNLKNRDFDTEFKFTTSRSSGKGGQHVNKTESRVSLFFNILESAILSDEEKNRIINSPSYQGTSSGQLQIDVETSRSQHKNKNEAVERFYTLLEKLLFLAKKRKKSKPSKAAIQKRLKEKKANSEKKQNRRKDFT